MIAASYTPVTYFFNDVQTTFSPILLYNPSTFLTREPTPFSILPFQTNTMIRSALLSLLGTFLSLTSLQAQTLDVTRSVIHFSVSNLAINTVTGTINGMRGDVHFDPANLAQSRFETTVAAATIFTDNEERDTHLKSEDFFDVTNYPLIRFKSESIKKSGSGYEVLGQLTIKDVTQQVSIPFSVTSSGTERTFTGNIKIKRKEYHLGESYGTFMMGSEIKVEIVCVVKV
jgi:polyisoprenoid-binding protein YceI